MGGVTTPSESYKNAQVQIYDIKKDLTSNVLESVFDVKVYSNKFSNQRNFQNGRSFGETFTAKKLMVDNSTKIIQNVSR